MSFFVHFVLGFLTSFIGTIPPSMLNMTTAKISVQQERKEAIKFALGVSIVVFIQAYLAIFFARYIHDNANFEWYISVFSIIIFAGLSVYFFKEAKFEKKKTVTHSKVSKNNFSLGLLLSSLNMFAIPFYCGVGSSLNMSGLLKFDGVSVLLFVIGSTIGAFSLLYVYANAAIRISKKAAVLTKNLNYILSIVTFLIALVTFIKIL